MDTGVLLLSSNDRTKPQPMKNLFTLLAMLIASQISFAQTSGGPDAYGYEWRDSNDPNGPTFNWIDITAVGTPVTGLTDDNASAFITMGMVFHYYWTDVTKVIIGSNGWVGMSPTANIAHCFPAIPTAGGSADHFLAPMMTDLLISQPGFNADVYYHWDQPNQQFIISYVNAPWWNANPPGYLGSNTFQVILSAADSSITYQYLDVDQVNLNNQAGCAQDLVIGMENVTGDIGLNPYTEIVPPDNYAIKFYYPNPVTYTIQDATPQWNQNTENKGQFVLANSDFNLQTAISNVGNTDISDDIAITANVSDLNNINVYSALDTVSNLSAGGTNTVVFPVSANLAPGQYFFETETSNPNDINPGNDVTISELNAVDMSQGAFTLSYATQNPPFTSVAWTGGGGVGAYYKPPSYPVFLDSIGVYIVDAGGSQDFTLEVYDDDQGSNIPGSVLSTQVVSGFSYLPNQWVNVPLSSPLQIDSGGVYIGWIHQTGNTIALGTEQVGPISQQSYEYVGGGWAVYRENDNTELLINGYFTSQCGSFTVNTDDIQHVTCFGGADAEISVTATGGTPPINFNWDNAVGAVEDPSGLNAGIYVLTVTDGAGCQTGVSVTVNQPAAVSGTGVESPEQQGGDGSIDFTPSGGTPPYTYVWSNGSTDQDPSGLIADTYTVTVTDSEGCTGTVTVEVTNQVGISDLELINLQVYPNPNSGEFSVVGDFGDGVFDVTDLSGRIVESTSTWLSDRVTINIKDASTGTYLVRWIGDNGIGVTRISVTQ